MGRRLRNKKPAKKTEVKEKLENTVDYKVGDLVAVQLDGGVWWPSYVSCAKPLECGFWEETSVINFTKSKVLPFPVAEARGLINRSKGKVEKRFKHLLLKYQKDLDRCLPLKTDAIPNGTSSMATEEDKEPDLSPDNTLSATVADKEAGISPDDTTLATVADIEADIFPNVKTSANVADKEADVSPDDTTSSTLADKEADVSPDDATLADKETDVSPDDTTSANVADKEADVSPDDATLADKETDVSPDDTTSANVADKEAAVSPDDTTSATVADKQADVSPDDTTFATVSDKQADVSPDDATVADKQADVSPDDTSLATVAGKEADVSPDDTTLATLAGKEADVSPDDTTLATLADKEADVSPDNTTSATLADKEADVFLENTTLATVADNTCSSFLDIFSRADSSNFTDYMAVGTYYPSNAEEYDSGDTMETSFDDIVKDPDYSTESSDHSNNEYLNCDTYNNQGNASYVPDSDSSDMSDVLPLANALPALRLRSSNKRKRQKISSGDKENANLTKKAKRPNIVIQLSNNTEDKRVWDKQHFCFYCDASSTNISKHYMGPHKSETEVQKILSFQKKSKGRKLELMRLRNAGDYKHNTEVLKKGEGLLVTWARNSENELSCKDFLPCEDCLGFFLKTNLWRHRKVCPFRKVKDGANCRVQSEACLLLPASHEVSKGLQKNVFGRMNADEITIAARNDRIITKVGEKLYQKNGHLPHLYSHVSQKMRELARLLITVRQLQQQPDTSIMSLSDLLHPEQFFVAVIFLKSQALMETHHLH